MFGQQGSIGLPFVYTGEMRDPIGVHYHRARYYNPAIGGWLSLDPFEGTATRPMSLNGYSWVEGNVVMNIDPGGKCVPKQICLTNVIDPCECFKNCIPPATEEEKLFYGCGNGDSTPTPTPCNMRSRRGFDVLAATAYTETDRGGPLAQNPRAVTALMLIQVNNFIATNERNWKQLGTWTKAGLTQETVVANPNQAMINNIASLMVEGYCRNPANFLSQVNVNYPTIATDQRLQDLAGNPDVRFEISIDATRVDEFRQDEQQPLQYVIEVPASTRAIVIGGGNVPRARIAYQCSINEQYVITDFPDVIRGRETNNALSDEGNFACRPKPCGIAEWYVLVNSGERDRISTILGRPLTGSGSYEIVNPTERLSIRQEFPDGALGDYVKECR